MVKIATCKEMATISFHSVITYSHNNYQRTNTQKLKYLPASWETPQEHVCPINTLPGHAVRTTSVLKTVRSQMPNMNLLITGIVSLRNHQCGAWPVVLARLCATGSSHQQYNKCTAPVDSPWHVVAEEKRKANASPITFYLKLNWSL